MDDIALCEAVEERFITLCNSYLQIRGVMLVPPSELDRDLLLWRTMRKRHKTADFRNTADELKAVQRIAQWTLDVNDKLRNQEAKVLEWR
jgi:hypothetical protein